MGYKLFGCICCNANCCCPDTGEDLIISVTSSGRCQEIFGGDFTLVYEVDGLWYVTYEVSIVVPGGILIYNVEYSLRRYVNPVTGKCNYIFNMADGHAMGCGKTLCFFHSDSSSASGGSQGSSESSGSPGPSCEEFMLDFTFDLVPEIPAPFGKCPESPCTGILNITISLAA